MNEQVPDENKTRGKAKTGRSAFKKVGTGLAIGGLVVAAGAGGTYLNRRALADEILVGWLQKRGIAADVQVDRLDWDGFTGRVVIGDPKNPDVRVERVDVDYAIGLPWSKAGMGLTPSRVVLSQPLIKAQWLDNQLSLGSLDPLIKELTSKPPTTDKRGPLIVVEKGEAQILTEYGLLTLQADAKIDDGRLKALSARIPQTALNNAALTTQGLTGALEAGEEAGTLNFSGHFSAQSLALTDVKGEALDLRFAGSAPYPASGATKAQGAVVLKADLKAAELQSADFSARNADAGLDWQGQIDGWIDAFVLKGQGIPTLKADQLRLADQSLTRAALTGQRLDVELSRGQEGLHGDKLFWKVQGPLSINAVSGNLAGYRAEGLSLSSGNVLAGGWGKVFEVQSPLRLAANRLSNADLTLNSVAGQFVIDAISDSAFKLNARGSLSARDSAYAGLGVPAADDAEGLAQIKQAARSFDLIAPDLRFVMGGSHSELMLGQPLTLKPRSGGEVVLAQMNRPVFQQSQGQVGGAAYLRATGGGLPELDLKLTQWRAQGGGLVADIDAHAVMDFATAKGIDLTTQGQLSVRQGVTSYQPAQCAKLGVSQFAMDENTLDGISGNLCATQGPLFRMAQGRWQLQGRLDQAKLAATFLEASLTDGRGALLVSGDQAGMQVDLGVQSATLLDDAKAPRFNPLNGVGRLSLASDIWKGSFDLRAMGQSVAGLCLSHNGKTAFGGLGIVTVGMDCQAPRTAQDPLPQPIGGLSFAQHGLQPGALSPMLKPIFGEAANGRAAFVGQMFWGAEDLQSSGHLVISDLSFDTPIGVVRGGKGDIHLTGLAPLEIPSGQTIRFDSVDGPLPMHDARVDLGFADNAVYLQHASVQLAKGTVYLFDSALYGPFSAQNLPPREGAEKGMEIPLNETRSWQFGVALDAVQLNDLVVALGGQQKASLDAEVSGVLPVTYRPEWGFAVSNGVLVANRKGSLSIAPEVLGNVDAGVGQLSTDQGDQAPVPRNMMQDLAYQALEHLTFTDLRADVNSVCLPKADLTRAVRGMIDISNSGGEFCQNLQTEQGVESGWVPSRLALDFAINGYYDPPERREMRLSLFDVLRGDFMRKKMILPSDTPVTLGLKVSLNAYDLASQVMDYMRMRNSEAENP